MLVALAVKLERIFGYDLERLVALRSRVVALEVVGIPLEACHAAGVVWVESVGFHGCLEGWHDVVPVVLDVRVNVDVASCA